MNKTLNIKDAFGYFRDEREEKKGSILLSLSLSIISYRVCRTCAPRTGGNRRVFAAAVDGDDVKSREKKKTTTKRRRRRTLTAGDANGGRWTSERRRRQRGCGGDDDDDDDDDDDAGEDAAERVKLASLATLLERAVVRDLADELANEDAECSVDYDQEVFEECTNRVTEQLAEVVVLCNSADIASKYSSNLRNKELSRLRGALWNLRVLLESYCATKGGCSLNVRHR